MIDPQRYDLVTNYRCGSAIEEMERADDGEWVRWEQVAALTAERDKWKADYRTVNDALCELQAEHARLVAGLTALEQILKRLAAADLHVKTETLE